MNTIKDTKECPMCAETVKARAKICRFCRHEFEFETEEIYSPVMDSIELETPETENEIFYDVWLTSCPSACESKVVEIQQKIDSNFDSAVDSAVSTILKS